MARVVFLFLAGVMLILQPRSVEQVIGLIVLWQLGSLFIRASLLNAALYFSPALRVFNCLPISDENIFKTQFRTFLRGSLWSAVDFSILYYVLAAKAGNGIYSTLTAICFGTIEWFFIVAFAVSLVVIGVRTFFYHLSLLFTLAAFGLLFFLPNKQAIAEGISATAYWVPPVGWLIHALGITPSKGALLDLLPCIFSAIVLMIFPIAYQRVRQRYLLPETIFLQAARMTPSPMAGPADYPEVAATFTEQAAEAVTRIKQGELRAGLDWNRLGIMERFVACTLTERQRTITDYLVAGNPSWTAGFRGFVILVLILLAGASLFASVAKSVSGGLLTFSAFVVFGTFFGKWRGFASPQGAGLQSPFYALYPIDIWELLRLLLKITLLRFALFLPFAVAGFLVIGRVTSGGSVIGLSLVKFLIVGFSLPPFLTIAQISPGTNDGQKPRIVLVALAFLILIGVCAFTIVVSITLARVSIAGLLLVALSYGSPLIYATFYNNNRFDLVANQLPTGSPH